MLHDPFHFSLVPEPILQSLGIYMSSSGQKPPRLPRMPWAALACTSDQTDPDSDRSTARLFSTQIWSSDRVRMRTNPRFWPGNRRSEGQEIMGSPGLEAAVSPEDPWSV